MDTITSPYSTKPFFGFGWIETNARCLRTIQKGTTKPFFGFGWIETLWVIYIPTVLNQLLNPSSASAGLKLKLMIEAIGQSIHLLNPSSASAGLKHNYILSINPIYPPTKPFFGFGWIETRIQEYQQRAGDATKPFFGFGWIETILGSISATNQLPTKPFFGFGWIETLNLYILDLLTNVY